jgi:thiamine-phosphate pyrophosphorylase
VQSGRIQLLHGARLYLVCDELPDAFLHAVLRGGVELVQLRMKDAGDAQLLAAAARYRAVCHEHGALLIVNDRPDLAAQAGADGVHVGQDDVTVADARAIVGPDAIVGLSTHTPDQIEAAGDEPVDYIGVGPVHATPTKPARPAVGTELVAYARAHAPVPFFAIGGIDADNVAAVLAAGADRIAVVRALTEAIDPEQAARALRLAVTRDGSDRRAISVEASVGST